jgi:hypothetical protein
MHSIVVGGCSSFLPPPLLAALAKVQGLCFAGTCPLTGRPTRTHNCRRRLRRASCGPVAFNVIWHRRRMLRVAATSSSASRSRCMVTLLGAARPRSGESRAYIAETKLRRSHGFGQAGVSAPSFRPAGHPLRSPGRSGRSQASGLAASGAMRACPAPASFAFHRGSYNWSANTDPQLQGAASPRVLWSGYLQR